MKKGIIISLAFLTSFIALLLLSDMTTNDVFEDNIEALAESEQQHAFGRCAETTDMCMGYCQDCGELVYAEGHRGPGFDIHH